MSYTALKQYIEDRVYENTSQQITGDGLQEALLQMVDVLGNGYQLLGVATTSTTPPSPLDQKVFYIASEVGTYTNLGDVQLSEGELGIIKYDGSWTIEKLSTNFPYLEAAEVTNDGKTLLIAPKDGEEISFDLTDLYEDKVDKVEGKGLSTNDYTNEEKEKLAALPTNAELNEDFAKKDGFYETLGAGYASSLLGTGASVPAEFTARPSGGTADIASGVATIKNIKGNTVVWNQLANVLDSIYYDGLTITRGANGYIKIVGTTTTSGFRLITTGLGYLAGRKVLIGTTNPLPEGSSWSANYDSGKRAMSVLQLSSTFDGSFSIRFGANTTFNFEGYYKIFDLTTTFGAGNEPVSNDDERIKWLMSLNAPYNAGELLSLTAESLVTDGFNQWDEEWEGNMQWDVTIGQVAVKTNYNGRLCNKNLIEVFGGVDMFIRIGETPVGSTNQCYIYFYDSEKILRERSYMYSPAIHTPSYCKYISFSTVDYGVEYKNDICINLSHSGSRNGEYEPYWQATKNLNLTTIKGKLNGQGESVTIFPQGMRSAGSAADELNGNEAIVRVGAVDLGSLTWTAGESGLFLSQLSGLKLYTLNDVPNILCARYTTAAVIASSAYAVNGYIYQGNANAYIFFRDSAFIGRTAEEVKTLLTGVMLYYELATPQTYTLDEPLALDYRVDDFGAERIEPLTDEQGNPATAPIKSNIVYGPNVQDAIRRMPTLYLSITDYKAGIGNLATALGTSLGKTIAVAWGGENNSVPTFNITDNA